MLREEATVVANALPVAVGDFGDDLAALLDGFEHETDVELAANSALDADFHVVEIDEDGNTGTTRVSVGHEKCWCSVGVACSRTRESCCLSNDRDSLGRTIGQPSR